MINSSQTFMSTKLEVISIVVAAFLMLVAVGLYYFNFVPMWLCIELFVAMLLYITFIFWSRENLVEAMLEKGFSRKHARSLTQFNFFFFSI